MSRGPQDGDLPAAGAAASIAAPATRRASPGRGGAGPESAGPRPALLRAGAGGEMCIFLPAGSIRTDVFNLFPLRTQITARGRADVRAAPTPLRPLRGARGPRPAREAALSATRFINAAHGRFHGLLPEHSQAGGALLIWRRKPLSRMF